MHAPPGPLADARLALKVARCGGPPLIRCGAATPRGTGALVAVNGCAQRSPGLERRRTPPPLYRQATSGNTGIAVAMVCARLLPEYLATMLSVCVQWLSMPARPCSSEGIETRSPGESPVLHIYMVCLTYT